ncbi:MAG: LuxR C-terminal-related transcriptional regulator, partial [Thermanaerothrix sp.]|nr:LuxR C-terminal-related transcriptional regulator [Thermanaerothrix sp.]
ILLKRNDLDAAQSYLARGLELCQRWLPTSIALEGYLHLAHLRQSLGDWDGAQAALDQAHAMVHLTQSDLDDRIVHLYRLRLGLLRGEWAPAWEWAQREGWLSPTGLDFAAVAEPPLLDIYLRLTLARLLLALAQAQGEPTSLAQARHLLDTLLPRLEQADFVEAQIEAHLLRALVLERQGEREEAVAALCRALALAEPEGFRRPFLDEGLALLPLLGHVLGRLRRHANQSTPPSAAFVQPLIAALASVRQTAPADVLDVETTVLTPREREILRLVAQGLSNGEIALTLCLALNTVKRHLNNLYLKLGVRTRTQAVARARALGLLD